MNNEPVSIEVDCCKNCGGKCCRIYKVSDDGESAWSNGDMYFTDYLEMWEERFAHARTFEIMKPQFDPWEAHRTDKKEDVEFQRYLQKLKDNNIDIEACQYHNKDKGCLLPRSHRPDICLEFACGYLLEIRNKN